MTPTIALIDGHYYLYRLFFGMPPLTGPGGRPTGVTYGFANLLKDLKANAEITHWAAVFDLGDSFRNTEFPEYKAHRDPMPEMLKTQIPDVEAILDATGCPRLTAPGYEADDTLATLAKQAEAAGWNVLLLTKDKDIDQVLSDRVNTWDPGKGIRRGPAELLAEKGITPAQVIDYLSMVGDTADNVPGIDGVGPKTASKLLAEHGSLAAILAAVDTLKGKQQDKVRAFIPRADLTRRLITLVDVPGLPPLDGLLMDRSRPVDAPVYARFGFTTARFQKPAGGASPASTAASPASAGTPASNLGEPYKILTLADLPELVTRLKAAGRFAIDTETTGLDAHQDRLVGISFAWGRNLADDAAEPRAAAYLPLLGQDHPCVPWEDARPILAPLLADAAVKKIGQNSKFDERMLLAHGAPVVGYDGDPMLASWLLDPGRTSHGLDFLTEAFLGETKIPTSAVIDLKAGQTMAMVPVTIVARYACEDAQCTWRLALLLEKKLEDAGLLQVYRDQELPIARCLAAMEHAGIAVDPAVLLATQEHLAAYLAQVEADIRAQTSHDFNPASPKQVAEVLFGKLKLPVISSTKTGPSTDAATLEALRGYHELPDLLLQYRTLSKLIGTYLAPLPGFINPTTGRIHTHYKQTGTETGRLSSDTPNLQNIPKKRDLGREIRGAFHVGAGRVLIAADYSQVELRILAHLSGDPTLCRAFHEGADIHRFVAAQVAGVFEEAVTPQQRNAAKAVNFGIIYGQTAFGLAGQLGIPRGQAQTFIDGYFARFSTVRAYIDRTVAEATEKGFVTTMAGRHRHIPQLAGNKTEQLQGARFALNSTIQGSAADLIKVAMLRTARMLPPGARLILQIHDELIVEADEATAPAAAQALTEAMNGAWKLAVPLVAEARTGRTWLDVS